MRTDVTACYCTQGCADTVRESALKVDSGRKIPCHIRNRTCVSGMPGWCSINWATSPSKIQNWPVRTLPLPDQQHDYRKTTAGMPTSWKPQASLLAGRVSGGDKAIWQLRSRKAAIHVQLPSWTEPELPLKSSTWSKKKQDYDELQHIQCKATMFISSDHKANNLLHMWEGFRT